MRWTLLILTASLMIAVPVARADVRADFQNVLDDLNEESFDAMRRVIDPDEMLECVYGLRTIDPQVREAVFDDFWSLTEAVVLGTIPNAERGRPGDLISFEFANGEGAAVVRYPHKGFTYTYLVFELYHDSRERLRIRNWYDSSVGYSFCGQYGDALVVMMPSKEATRQQVAIDNPTDLQLFQVTEIFKAGRDSSHARFFEIYDQLDEPLKRQPLIANFAVWLSLETQNQQRYLEAMEVFLEIHGTDPAFSLLLADYYLRLGMFQSAIDQMEVFRNRLPADEGATAARISAAALALGEDEQAEEYAVMATTLEPTLELGWWSLLRARARVNNFSGALEALTQLEDGFDKRIDASKLRRDRFRAFNELAASQEFKDWRASRP